MQKDVRVSYDDLESPWVAAVNEPPDLVASLVHVSTEGKLPRTTTSTTLSATTTSIPTEFVPAPTQQLPLLTQHHYVATQINNQQRVQVSHMNTLPAPKLTIVSSLSNSLESPASAKNARLTEPFSTVYPIYESDSESEAQAPSIPDQCRLSSWPNGESLND
jgi:hypothetical protein